MNKHTLTFEEAKAAIVSGKYWAQGEDFLHVHSFNKRARDAKLFLNSDMADLAESIKKQKFRLIEVELDSLENQPH